MPHVLFCGFLSWSCTAKLRGAAIDACGLSWRYPRLGSSEHSWSRVCFSSKSIFRCMPFRGAFAGPEEPLSCLLPVRPYQVRLTQSWAPRYLIGTPTLPVCALRPFRGSKYCGLGKHIDVRSADSDALGRHGSTAVPWLTAETDAMKDVRY